MKRLISSRGFSAVRFFFLSLLIVTGFASCTGSRQDIVPSAEFLPYVNAYTGGVVTQESTVRVELKNDLPMVKLNQEVEGEPFSFSPSLKGKSYWINNNTIEFVPDEGELKPGTFYKAKFRLGDYVEVAKKLKRFEFSFRVQERSFVSDVDPISVTAENPDVVSLSGEIRFNCKVSPETVKKMVTVRGYKDAKSHVMIEASEASSTFKYYLINIPRRTEDYNLKITVDGGAADIDGKQVKEVTIPAKDQFRFLSAKRIHSPEDGVEIVFSDPVSDTQDLKGLVEIAGLSNYVTLVNNNRVYVYFDVTRQGKFTLNLNAAILNDRGKRLGTDQSVSIAEENLKPQVTMDAYTAILPDSKNLIIPFRAVNLYAVDLSVIRIFENNVLSFMQENPLSGSYALRRSGRLIYKKTLWLTKDGTKNVHQWEDYSIDLSDFIKQEPGAIYRVLLSFKQEYSAYPCSGSDDDNAQVSVDEHSGDLVKVDGELSDEDKAVWDIPESYYYAYGNMDWSRYEWSERDNPCHVSYFMNAEHYASCNVLASNLGIVVKRNSLNKLWVAVTDMLTTSPLNGVKVTAYNYQLQPVATTETNGDGLAEVACTGKPFIVVAEKDKQKGYVRVVDGEEQSTSRFDVGGKEIVKGLKGYLYGERGVWRPGDTLHLSFILEDREKRIPDKHPVSLELYNPQGQFYTKQVSTQGLNGFYTFTVPTRQNDPTGLWNAYVKVGGSAFHKSLRIETIKPNRLKINVTLPPVLKAEQRQVSVPLSASWLMGAKASGLKTTVEMQLAKVNTQFGKYSQYLFNDPTSEFVSNKSEVYSGSLDANGNGDFMLKLPASTQAPGMLNATFTSRVFEPGGDVSFHTQTVPFSPYASYVGINLNQPKGKYIETDKDHVFDVVTVDADGKPTSRSCLEYKIYKISWDWWWESDQKSFGTYVNNSSVTPVASGRLRTDGGKTSFNFKVSYPDWGRYLVYVKDTESHHATGGVIYVDWPSWRGRSARKDPSGVKMLTFSLDKESYGIGEKATAIIPASVGGRALVSIENGSTVLKQEWVSVTEGTDVKYTFEVTPEMTPNVYLHVTLLQPHAQTVNDLPIRMYGVAPVLVNNKATKLEPRISMPEELKPETDFQVTVSEKNGKPMTYTLAIVDDGLLDLTGFKTPDPWNEFYSREALGIRTWDMYDDVLGAFAGKFGGMFGVGGDAELKPAEAKANRFKPVVKFVGPYYIGKGERKTHSLKLPMYVGSVRVMVVAGQDGAYGNAEKSVRVRTPLMLLSSLPRVLSVNEEISVPVNLFVMDKGIKQVDVTLSSKEVQLSPVKQTLTFAQPEDRIAYFRLKTSHAGKATINIVATGNGNRAQETVEIEVRNPNPVVNLCRDAWIEKGAEATIRYPMGDKAQLEVSRLPMLDVTRRLDYLYNYSHHCTEQITSKGLPLLFVDKLKEVDKEEGSTIRKNVEEAISRIYSRQLSNGGFVYWPGQSAADEWVTSYAGMFLTLAQEKGYAVHSNVLKKWRRYQKVAAQNWRAPRQDASLEQVETAEMQQAFRLYTLALANAPEYGAMNRLKELTEMPPQAQYRLAATYAVAGKQKVADELIFKGGAKSDSITSYWQLFGSRLRDEAMMLEDLVLTGHSKDAYALATRLTKRMAGEDEFNTQSTAFAIMALARLSDQQSGSLNFSWTMNGKKQPAVKSAKVLYTLPVETKKADEGTVTLRNNGDGTLYANVVSRLQLTNDTLPEVARRIRLTVSYTDMKGSPMAVDKVKQGTDFYAVVTVANLSAAETLNSLALTHIVPSGWEIYDEHQSGAFTYQDVRDDRVLTYFSLNPSQTKRFVIRLQANYVGDYILPAVQCEDMYDTSVLARSRAGRTAVVQ